MGHLGNRQVLPKDYVTSFFFGNTPGSLTNSFGK